jgi:hypothetical protein
MWTMKPMVYAARLGAVGTIIVPRMCRKSILVMPTPIPM